jgi:hypothetical protein
MQDDENTMLYRPEDYSGNRFLGQWSKVFNMSSNLMLEDKQKYHYKFMAHLKAKQEMESIPICFDECVTEFAGGHGLSGGEKNCIRECYFKRVSVRDDLNIYWTQRAATTNVKAMPGRLV